MPVETGPNLYGHPLHHLGYCVDSLEDAAEQWSKTLGVGPFFFMDVVGVPMTYEGSEAVFDHRTCFAAWGPINIELMQPLKAEPPDFAARLGVGQKGVAHYSYMVDDVTAEIERMKTLGFGLIHEASFGPVHLAFIDNPDMGMCIEIHKRTDFLNGVHDAVADAAVDWDGKEILCPLVPPDAS